MGLLTANLDSPMHSAWSSTKHSNAKTERPCQACKVRKSDLGEPSYNIKQNARSADGIRRDVEYVKAGANASECASRSRRKGVVSAAHSNPLDLVVFDPVQQIGMDILHQAGPIEILGLPVELEALNKQHGVQRRVSRYLRWDVRRDGGMLLLLCGHLDKSSSCPQPERAHGTGSFFYSSCFVATFLPANLVSGQPQLRQQDHELCVGRFDGARQSLGRARLATRRLLPPNVSPLTDITRPGGWTSLTGQELWILSSVFPFLTAPIFEDAASLVRSHVVC